MTATRIKYPQNSRSLSGVASSRKPTRKLARPRSVEVGKDGKNKLERRYGLEVLEPKLFTKEILSYQFESLKFKLAKRTFYTPDYVVVTPTHIEIHEVKGFWEDDARVKIKVVAELNPHFLFVAIQHKKGQWIKEAF